MSDEFDPESDDLYLWATDTSITEHGSASHRTKAWWSAWYAARRIAMILLTFTREREGQEITPEMIEEMRQLCARVAYD
mgnify:CR=1 FL=1